MKSARRASPPRARSWLKLKKRNCVFRGLAAPSGRLQALASLAMNKWFPSVQYPVLKVPAAPFRAGSPSASAFGARKYFTPPSDPCQGLFSNSLKILRPPPSLEKQLVHNTCFPGECKGAFRLRGHLHVLRTIGAPRPRGAGGGTAGGRDGGYGRGRGRRGTPARCGRGRGGRRAEGSGRSSAERLASLHLAKLSERFLMTRHANGVLFGFHSRASPYAFATL